MKFILNTVWLKPYGTRARWKVHTVEDIRFGLFMGCNLFFLSLDTNIRTMQRENQTFAHRDDFKFMEVMK